MREHRFRQTQPNIIVFDLVPVMNTYLNLLTIMNQNIIIPIAHRNAIEIRFGSSFESDSVEHGVSNLAITSDVSNNSGRYRHLLPKR